MQPEPGRSQEQQVATDDPADSEDDDEDEEETEHVSLRGQESRFLAPVRRMVSRFWQIPPAAPSVPRSPAQPRGLRALLTRFLMPSRFLRRPVAPPLPPQTPKVKPLKSRFDQSAGPKM